MEGLKSGMSLVTTKLDSALDVTMDTVKGTASDLVDKVDNLKDAVEEKVAARALLWPPMRLVVDMRRADAFRWISRQVLTRHSRCKQRRSSSR